MAPSPKKPRRPRPWLAPSEIVRAASDALPRLPLSPFPNRFTEPSPPAMSADRNAHPVPDLKPGFFQHQAALSRGAALAVANAPFEMAREVSRARNPDEVIHGLTGVGLSMDPKSPARRPNDAHGGRFGQGVAVALSALGLGEMGAEIGTAERAYATGLRNAERFAANTKSVRPTLDALANHIDPMHVPAFERAGSSVRDGMFGRLVGDLNPIARTRSPLSVTDLEIPTFLRQQEALMGGSPYANPDVARVAALYRARSGIRGRELPGFREVNPEAGRRMANAYERATSNPNDPEVKAAYRALVNETDAQYKAIEDAGYRIEYVDKDPYDYRSNTGSDEMMDDIRNNRRLKVLRTAGENSSPHPLLTDTENERFRAVHDFFGHTVQHNSFDLNGEEAAFRAHSAMYSPEAARAMATETRGQNSWFNFGPQSHLPYNDRPFPVQKATLWPAHLMGDYPEMMQPVGREVLSGPALRVGGKTYSTDFPHAHVHVLRQAEDALYDRTLPASQRSRPYYDALQKMVPEDEGFMARDEAGNERYVDRKEGARIYDQPITRFERTRAGKDELHAFDVARPIIGAPSTGPALLDLSPRYRTLADALLPDEQRHLTKRTMPAFEAAGETLPDDEIFGAGAIAGGAKLGWYANSARALGETFGPDAPRFAALLASLSPQRPVSENLRAALDLWDVWNHTGRPQDPATITRLMHDVARKSEAGGELGARIPNSIRALTSEDPSQLALSGPKVFNFHRNLMGDAQRVTLDTWMAKLGGLKGQSGLSRTVRGFGQPSPLYLAYSGRIRQTADYLSKLTGREWTPAETQETLWSWGKALTETAQPLARGAHPSQMDMLGHVNFSDAIPLVTQNKIRGVPDFATLMNEAPYAEHIQNQGLPLPIPRSTLPPKLPPPDPLGLDFLSGNLQRTLGSGQGNAALPMLGLSGSAALGGMTLWDYLKRR